MSRNIVISKVNLENPEILAKAANLLGLQLEKNVNVRYYGGSKKKHPYGIILKDCPYDLGFIVKDVKNDDGVMVSVLQMAGDSELLDVKDENSFFWKKSQKGLEKIGFQGTLIEQAYNLVSFCSILEENNISFNLNTIDSNRIVVEALLPNSY